MVLKYVPAITQAKIKFIIQEFWSKQSFVHIPPAEQQAPPSPACII